MAFSNTTDRGQASAEGSDRQRGGSVLGGEVGRLSESKRKCVKIAIWGFEQIYQLGRDGSGRNALQIIWRAGMNNR